MVRALRLLLLLVLCLQAGSFLPEAEAFCGDSRSCATDDGCDTDCAICACCVGRVSNVSMPQAVAPMDAAPQRLVCATPNAKLPPLPSDILHVPKSA